VGVSKAPNAGMCCNNSGVFSRAARGLRWQGILIPTMRMAGWSVAGLVSTGRWLITGARRPEKIAVPNGGLVASTIHH